MKPGTWGKIRELTPDSDNTNLNDIALIADEYVIICTCVIFLPTH